jgi:hypothetical protein
MFAKRIIKIRQGRNRFQKSFDFKYLWIVAPLLMIHVMVSDARSDWKIMKWQPFQVKSGLILEGSRDRTVEKKTGKKTARKSSKSSVPPKTQSQKAVLIYATSQVYKSRPDMETWYLSVFSSQLWEQHRFRNDLFLTVPTRGDAYEPLFLSDISRDVMNQPGLGSGLTDKEADVLPAELRSQYFRLSFFNRDAKLLNRDALGRAIDPNINPFDFLKASPDQRLESIGKTLEPKVDLEIRF